MSQEPQIPDSATLMPSINQNACNDHLESSGAYPGNESPAERHSRYQREWYARNREKMAVKSNERYQRNKDAILAQAKEHYHLIRDDRRKESLAYYYAHKQERLEYMRLRRKRLKEELTAVQGPVVWQDGDKWCRKCPSCSASIGYLHKSTAEVKVGLKCSKCQQVVSLVKVKKTTPEPEPKPYVVPVFNIEQFTVGTEEWYEGVKVVIRSGGTARTLPKEDQNVFWSKVKVNALANCGAKYRDFNVF